MMILNTAWKNVWRNKTRSLVVISSITVGIFAGIFAVGLMNGVMEQRVDAALNQEIAHIQINHKDFNENYDINLTLENIDRLNKDVMATDAVVALSNRTVISAMANTAARSTGVQVIGIDPEQEKAILDLDEAVIPGTGSFFESESRSSLAYIGQDLAKELNIIRYRIEQSTLDSLRQKDVPEEVITKLSTFTGKRFPSQKAFSKAVKKVLSTRESYEYANIILEEAWSFRARSKLTLTFVDRNNYPTGGMFRIAGIYDIKNGMFEKTRVFVKNEDLISLTGLKKNEFHKCIIRVDDMDLAEDIAHQLKASYPELEIRDWVQIQPELAMMTGMIGIFNTFLIVIILLALSFGIVNTMLMVVLERTKELGMLTAIGMNKKKVFSMIISESVFLSLVGGVVGMIISRIFIALTGSKGINFASAAEGFEAMGFSAHIYPSVSDTFFITVTILIVITGILSSVYPAFKALRLDPADALRTE